MTTTTLATIPDDKFLATAAALVHDLRTPLNTVASSANTFLFLTEEGRPSSPEDLKTYFTGISASAYRLTQLIDVLWCYALCVTGKLRDDLDLVGLEVTETLKSTGTLETWQTVAQQRQVTLQTEMAAPVFLRADKTKLMAVLTGCFFIALKRANAETVIRLTVAETAKYVEICLSDNGAPLPTTAIGPLSEPLAAGERLDGQTVLLAVYRAVTEAHAGASFTIESVTGQTAVLLRWPVI